MTMIAPDHNPEPPAEEAKPPYAPMAALREWRTATRNAGVPGGVQFIEEPDAFSRRKNVDLAMSLIAEEFREVQDELLDARNNKGDRSKLAKELADLVYVAYNCADNFEIPLEDVFNAVHASNMTKVGLDGKVTRRGDGKILKGLAYKEPDIDSVLFGGIEPDSGETPGVSV